MGLHVLPVTPVQTVSALQPELLSQQSRKFDSKKSQSKTFTTQMSEHSSRQLERLNQIKELAALVPNPKLHPIANRPLIAFYKEGFTNFLGNFYPSEIDVFGHHFLCVEAAFQWSKAARLRQKYANKISPDDLRKIDTFLDILFTSEGQQAWNTINAIEKLLKKSLPREKIYPDNWLNIRIDIMWECLQAKFNQNFYLMDLLKATGEAYLLEHNDRSGKDNVWSDNHDGSGSNWLGQMLMDIRDEKLTFVKPYDQGQEKIKAYAERANSEQVIIDSMSQ